MTSETITRATGSEGPLAPAPPPAPMSPVPRPPRRGGGTGRSPAQHPRHGADRPARGARCDRGGSEPDRDRVQPDRAVLSGPLGFVVIAYGLFLGISALLVSLAQSGPAVP